MSKDLLENIVIRPVRSCNLESLLNIVQQSSGGLSSLQPRRKFLSDYIVASEKSFAGLKDIQEPHKYLLGMFHHDRLIGCAAVKTHIGVDSPFINFDIVGDGLDQYLESSSRFMGATEVGSLFLHPDYRAYGLGKYLAKVRYLLMATEPWRFGETVIAELRGICGVDGSPLYDYLFKYKLEKTFLEADNEYYDRNPDALGDIVPIGAVDVAKFPIDVRASLAQPHPSGKAAMRMLLNEGFIFSGTIDLFDAGPIVYSYRDTIRTIMERKTGSAIGVSAVTGGHFHLISAGKVSDFRAVICEARSEEEDLIIPEKSIDDLELNASQEIAFWSENIKFQRQRKSIVKAHI